MKALLGLMICGVLLLCFGLVLGFNLGVGQSALYGPSAACEMIRVQLVDCAALQAEADQ